MPLLRMTGRRWPTALTTSMLSSTGSEARSKGGDEMPQVPGITPLGDDRYRVRYRLEGHARSKTITGLRNAQRFKATVEADKSRHEIVDPKLGRERFGAYARRWLETKSDVHPRTLSNITARIDNHYDYLKQRPIGAIVHSDVLAWRARLANELAATTVNASLGTLRQIFALAVLDRVIPRNPCDGVKALPFGTRKRYTLWHRSSW
jgi:hypothetical protein